MHPSAGCSVAQPSLGSPCLWGGGVGRRRRFCCSVCSVDLCGLRRGKEDHLSHLCGSARSCMDTGMDAEVT